MSWDEIEGNWKKFKDQAALQWDLLTDEQLETIAGRRDKLAESIRNAYGVSEHAAEWQLSGWQQRQHQAA